MATESERITKSNAVVRRMLVEGVPYVVVIGCEAEVRIAVIQQILRCTATSADGCCELLELLVEARLERAAWYREILTDNYPKTKGGE